jgi:cysteinyl-tRNA synthetase
MALRFHNTLTRRVEPFVPLDPALVRVYACGPTIYDFAHIGNFRTFLVFDLLHRTLEWRGYAVKFVMNFTDVDDKVIRVARERGVRIEEHTEPFAQAFLADADALGLERFDLNPRATQYIAPMIRMVERLIERGLAYVTDDGSVYFRIAAFPDYGKLSGIDPDQVRSGARVAVDEYGKDDLRDFALWKAARPDEEAVGAGWESPWGVGRPGWHLECSAMSQAELGETLDIHLGGEDLIFPHHEDEIAQSEGATGKPFVRTWLHVKHLLIEGRKMSKSLGNTTTLRNLLDEGIDPASIRHLLLGAHYRSEINLTREGLEASGRAMRRLLDFRDRLERTPSAGDGTPAGLAVLAERGIADFGEALDDDLNSPGALAALFVMVGEMNAALDRVKGRVLESDLLSARAALASMDRVLGLVALGSRGRVVEDDLRHWVEGLLEERRTARQNRNFARADAIRVELLEAGVVVEDTAEGSRWKRVGG